MLKRIEDLVFQGLKGISEQQVQNLLEFTWIDRNENLLFFGPPGLGKPIYRSAWDWKRFREATRSVLSG